MNSDVIHTLNQNYSRKQKQLLRGIKTLCWQNPGWLQQDLRSGRKMSFCKQQSHDAWCKNADLLQMKIWSVSVVSSVLCVTLISYAPLSGRHMIFYQIGDISTHSTTWLYMQSHSVFISGKIFFFYSIVILFGLCAPVTWGFLLSRIKWWKFHFHWNMFFSSQNSVTFRYK